MFYKRFGKRALDLLIAAMALLLLSPLMLLVALLVRLKLGSPVIFRQERPGYRGEIFTLYKFRTMREAVDENGEPLPDGERHTPFGWKLRETSLDELPELWNILKGDMSLVGPRPLLVQYLPLYNSEQMRRHEVKPGLTGWAQLHGRNTASWPERFRYDVEYVDGYSFAMDIKIVWKTVAYVLKREGVNASDTVSATYFTGNGEDGQWGM